MLKSKSLAMLFVSMGLIAVMAVTLISYLKSDTTSLANTVTVSEDGVVKESIEISSMTLNPDESRENYIFLRSEIDGNFNVTISFEEIQNGDLKNFVNVSVLVNDIAVQDETLLNLLSGTAISFNENLNKTDAVIVKIVYKMPKSVGNEAQGTTASFNIRIKIQN